LNEWINLFRWIENTLVAIKRCISEKNGPRTEI
jgi:hypothetical protein